MHLHRAEKNGWAIMTRSPTAMSPASPTLQEYGREVASQVHDWLGHVLYLHREALDSGSAETRRLTIVDQ